MKKILALTGLVLIAAFAGPACVTRVVYQQPVAAPAPPPPPPSPYPPGATAAVEMFYDDLAPHGSWVRVEGPGWVWRPATVPAGWRPYALGRWVYTDYGWTWDAEESWGWAVYHYGRWHHTARFGWVWVPGTEWGPAWVTWHSGGGWAGWAPLPWGVEWRAGAGLDWGRVDVRVAIEPAWWCFVPVRHLADPRPARHFPPAHRNAGILKMTRHVTHYTVVDNRVFNRGILVDEVGRAAGRPVPRVRVREADTPAPAHARGPERDGGDLVVYRPGLRRGQRPGATPARSTPDRPEHAGRDGDGGSAPAVDETTANERPAPKHPAARTRPAPPSWRDRIGRPAGRPAASAPAPSGEGEDEGTEEAGPGAAPEAAPRGDAPAPRSAGPASQKPDRAPQGASPGASGDAGERTQPATPRSRPQVASPGAGKTQPGAGKPQPGAAGGKKGAPAGKKAGGKDDKGSEAKDDAKPKDEPSGESEGGEAAGDGE